MLLSQIANQISTKFNFKIDIDFAEKVERPSFLIYSLNYSESDISKWITQENTLVRIVYYSPLSQDNLPDKDDQEKTLVQLKSIFSSPYIDVEEARYHITDRTYGYSGAADNNSSSKDIFMQFSLERLKARDSTEDQTIDLMQDVQININNNTEEVE